jgi:dipeptidyl aminopeptidase/acylaminoacyl peptidase
MPINAGAVGWMTDDTALILYDQCDIYQVDPMGKSAPSNLTRSFGRDHNIEFRLAMQNADHIFRANEELIISAFNRINKDDGFYSIVLGEKRMPQLLTMQPCIFTGTWDDDRFTPSGFPRKAKNAEVYLVRQMSASKSPNFFWTSDFKIFYQITDVHPEESYNWLTTELITWKMFDGKKAQGILYKPENFDPQKKYPLIIHYYERFSEGLHGFIKPNFCHGDLNIPYFVSNGYLVFTPDIYYSIGHPGESVLNTIVTAVNYLTSMGFVDVKHIGIQGHSRGGWETNYLVTHTRLFAAAMSASGFSNYISLYNGIRSLSSGTSRQTAFENHFQRIGATLWERPDLYIENSPIFKADYVTTPVLIMANKGDYDIPFEQGIEFFTALRRLGKKAWLLQYDGEKHMVFGWAAWDFTVRMKQFFDHYLMNAPAPMWMSKGIPAKLKGVNDGLELLH